MTHLHRLGLTVLLPAIVLGVVVCRAASISESEQALPDDQVREIIKGAVSKVRKALEDKPRDPATSALVRIQAGLIALSAQHELSGANAAEMAAVRDAGLKLGASVQRRRLNVEQAKKQMEILAGFPGLKADGSASTDPVDLTKKFSLETIMKVFDKTSKGGDGVEQELLTLEQQRRPYSAGQMSNKLAADAYKAILVADVARNYQPEKNRNNKDAWDQLCTDMKASASELAQTISQKDAKQVKAAVKKLNASCNTCHEKFR
jgi:Cytochrome C'